jgi:protein PsiE
MQHSKIIQMGQQGLNIFEKLVLLFIALATLAATGHEIIRMWQSAAVSVGDLLLLFLYLEVMSMLKHYLGSGKLPVRYPLYIGIVALARYMVLDIKDLDAWQIFAVSGAIFILAMSVLVVRYGHVRFPYSDGSDLHSR